MKGKDVKVGMKVYRNSKFHWARKPLFIAAEPGEYREYSRLQGNYGTSERYIKRQENDNPHSFNKATVAVSDEKGGKITDIVGLNAIISEEQYELQERANRATNERNRKELEMQDVLRNEAKEKLMALGFGELEIGFTGTRVTIHCGEVNRVLGTKDEGK